MKLAGRILMSLGALMFLVMLAWMADGCVHSMLEFHASAPEKFWRSIAPILVWIVAAALFWIGMAMAFANKDKAP